MEADLPSLVPGVTLHGTYVLERLLGRGGMGAVWRAKHARLPRPVAIKVLHEQAYESEELLLRFRREAEITSQLGHPHIVEVFDFNVLDDGRAYLVMELLEGQNLRERLRRGPPLEFSEAMRILEQMSSALAHAHRAGVVHRDLKPENLFLLTPAHEGAAPHVKVLDFGISKIQTAQTVLTQGASLMGTPRYMSPEQAQGDTAAVDGRADQFAVGAIAYEFFAGRPAFPGDTVTQVLWRVMQEEPAPLARLVPDLPAAVAEAVHRALSKDRARRFCDMDDFRLALGGLETRGPRLRPAPGPDQFTDPDAMEDTFRRPAPLSEPPDAKPATARSKGWFGLAAGAVVVAGAVAGAVYGIGAGRTPATSTRPKGTSPAGVLAGPAPRAETRTATGANLGDAGTTSEAADRVDAGTSPVSALGPADAGTVSADAGGTVLPIHPRRPVRPRPLPPKLAAAERAIERDPDEAIRLARQSLAEDDDRRAFVILAVAHCQKRDLAGAKAVQRGLDSAGRREVARRCRRIGMQL